MFVLVAGCLRLSLGFCRLWWCLFAVFCADWVFNVVCGFVYFHVVCLGLVGCALRDWIVIWLLVLVLVLGRFVVACDLCLRLVTGYCVCSSCLLLWWVCWFGWWFAVACGCVCG